MDEIDMIGLYQVLVVVLVSCMFLKVEQFNVQILDMFILGILEILFSICMDVLVDVLNEEIQEFKDVYVDGDVFEVVDVLVDLIYFVLGCFVEMGVLLLVVFDVVQVVNMVKVCGDLFKCFGWNGCDVVKFEGWQLFNYDWLFIFDLFDVVEFQELCQQVQGCEVISLVWLELQYLWEIKGQDYNNVLGGCEVYFLFGYEFYVYMFYIKNLCIQLFIMVMCQGCEFNYEGLYDIVCDLVNYGIYYVEWLKQQGFGGVK